MSFMSRGAIFWIFVELSGGLGLQANLGAQIPAFPGAEGFGAYATGGRGGDVYSVDNLNNSGPGSFAEAIATVPENGRTILFAVSGYIHVNKTVLGRSRVTIAGQTAPGDGIGFKDGTFIISGDDIVIRHTRFRYRDQAARGDCIDIDDGITNVILDHVSLGFSTDENISSFEQNPRPDLLTFQWSLNSWGLEDHSAGGLWDLERVTNHHSLWAHNHTRNPKARPYGLLDWINNVTFDWDIGFIMGDSQTPASWKANVIGNYFVCPPGNLRSVALEKASIDRNGNHNFTLHVASNLFDNNGNSLLDGSDRGYDIASGSYRISGSPIVVAGPQVPVTRDPPLTAYKKIVSAAGPLRLDAASSIPLRDEVDTILMDNLVTRTRNHVSHEDQTGASDGGMGSLSSIPPPADSDRDGMPDGWELTLGWNPTVQDHNTPLPDSGGIIAGWTFFPPGTPAGYTRLEEYLHFLAIPHATIPRSVPGDPTSVITDLRKFTRGFDREPVVFTLANVTNGTAQLRADGHTVEFAPAPGFSGRAGLEFTVTDGDGSTWTQTLAVLVSTIGRSRSLLWNGDGISNLWDSSTPNFLDESEAVAFSAGDRVLFDDSGFNSPDINIREALFPGIVRVDATRDFTFGGSGSIGGPMSLIKSGEGSLTLGNSGPNTFLQGTFIREGEVNLASPGALGAGPVVLENEARLHLGTLTLGEANSLTIAGSPTITGGNRGGLTDIHDVSGQGTLNIRVTDGVLDLAGSLEEFNGTLRFSGGNTVRFYGSTGSANTGFDLGSGPIRLNKRSSVDTVKLGALSGGADSILEGASGGGNTSPTTYSMGQKNLDTIFEGSIRDGQGTTGIIKNGAGTLTLSGVNTHTGPTTVNGGTLLIDGNNGSSAMTVNSGGTLGGTGTIGGLLTVQPGGIISPGDGGSRALTCNNGVTLNSPVMRFDLTASPSGENDRIILGGGLLTMTGTQTYRFRLVDGFLRPGTYTLIGGGANTSAAGVPLVHDLPAGTGQTYSLRRPPSGNGECYVRLVVTGTIAQFLRGDCNADGSVDISDAMASIFFQFLGGALSCVDAADVDDDSETDLTDIIYLLAYLFLEGPAPGEPYLSCGPDPTPDALSCESSGCP